jgi:hypothetical protein
MSFQDSSNTESDMLVIPYRFEAAWADLSIGIAAAQLMAAARL